MPQALRTAGWHCLGRVWVRVCAQELENWILMPDGCPGRGILTRWCWATLCPEGMCWLKLACFQMISGRGRNSHCYPTTFWSPGMLSGMGGMSPSTASGTAHAGCKPPWPEAWWGRCSAHWVLPSVLCGVLSISWLGPGWWISLL